MKFIIWFAVYWGMVELEYWRVYKYRGAEWFDNNSVLMLFVMIFHLLIFFGLWYKFIN